MKPKEPPKQPSAVEARKYWEARLAELSKDYKSNEEEIEAIYLMLKISE